MISGVIDVRKDEKQDEFRLKIQRMMNKYEEYAKKFVNV